VPAGVRFSTLYALLVLPIAFFTVIRRSCNRAHARSPAVAGQRKRAPEDGTVQNLV
jgi:hypothetical protein